MYFNIDNTFSHAKMKDLDTFLALLLFIVLIVVAIAICILLGKVIEYFLSKQDSQNYVINNNVTPI